jgi:hypothetical protein
MAGWALRQRCSGQDAGVTEWESGRIGHGAGLCGEGNRESRAGRPEALGWMSPALLLPISTRCLLSSYPNQSGMEPPSSGIAPSFGIRGARCLNSHLKSAGDGVPGSRHAPIGAVC